MDDDGGYGGEVPKLPSEVEEEVVVDMGIEYYESDSEN